MKIKVSDIVPYQNNMKHSRYGAYPTKRLKDFQKEVSLQIPNENIADDVPLMLEVIFYYHIPKSWTKQKKEQHKGKYKVSKPDNTNIIKSFEDVLADKLGIDDSRFVKHVITKKYNGNIHDLNNYIMYKITEIE